MRQEAADLKHALEGRKAVERAKGAVMQQLGTNEVEASRRLRRHACNVNRKGVEAAGSVLAVEAVFKQLEEM